MCDIFLRGQNSLDFMWLFYFMPIGQAVKKLMKQEE